MLHSHTAAHSVLFIHVSKVSLNSTTFAHGFEMTPSVSQYDFLPNEQNIQTDFQVKFSSSKEFTYIICSINV